MSPRRSAGPPQPQEIHQFRTAAEATSGITKLGRRIHDIEQLKADGVRHSDARVDAVEHAIRDTIRDVFGKDSPQFNRHHYFRIDDGPQYVRTDWGGSGASDPHEQRQFEEQMPGAITRLQGLIDQLEEKRADLGEPTIAPRAALAGRTIHPAILAAAERLYLGGHYTQAVFEAGKALISLVRAKSGSTQDGAPLMQSVFSVNNPILAFRDDLTDQSNKDEQQGMMHLYTGTVLAIRNPGGHRVGAVERPDRALQHLELLGYLADRLDEAKKVRNS